MILVAQHKRARRETGGPAAEKKPVMSSRSGAGNIEAQIIGLEGLTTGALRREWQRLYGATPPIRLSRDLLLRGIAYRVQERALGGLSPSTKRRLRALGIELARGVAARNAAPIMLRPGTKLVREWHQRVHTVDVLADGFEYQGERYASLSRIARRITGAAWSGPRFFGISKPPRRLGDAA
jgi:Protein of unknown function (DUF2924)